MKQGKLVFGLLILVLASCYLPQNPGNVDGTETDVQLAVKTDKSRDQGVYVNENGDDFDIVSEEGPDGKIVRCVEAVDIVQVDGGVGEAVKSFGDSGIVKALILGRRADGYPGVWEVLYDDSIRPVSYNEAGEKNSKAGDSCEVEWLMHGSFGWQYHVLKPILGPDSEGGYIFVGYAENTRGVDFGGPWTIEEGTTVAVYWRLEKKYRHFHLSRARIIGEPNEDYSKWNKTSDKDFPNRYRYRHSMLVHFFLYLFDSFKFFFLESFDIYLTDVLEAEYDKEKDLYLVTGHVDGSFSQSTPTKMSGKGGNVEKVEEKEKETTTIGTAAITPNGEITITVKGGGNGGNGNGGTYERIVIDTYKAWLGGAPDTDLILYDETGKELGRDEPIGGGPGRIDTDDPSISPLSSGIYYIRVYDKDSGYVGPYAVRALSLAAEEALPDPVVPGSFNTSDFPYESDDAVTGNVPTNPVEIPLGNDNYLNRYLYPGTESDWLILELPPL